MSLDYKLSDIQGWREQCLRPSEEHPGKDRLARKTNALIWASLLVDLGCIDEGNVDEWDFRLRVIYRMGLGPTDDKDRPTRDDIEQHIGLRTNVYTISRVRFMTKAKKMLEQAVKDELRSYNRQQRERRND